jgi:hypothetical protein
MAEQGFLSRLAEDVIANRMWAFNLLLPHYDDSVPAQIHTEQEELRLWAAHLDRHCAELVVRCKAAKSHAALILEMQMLRMHALQFNLFLRSVRYLLKVQNRRLAIRARLDGLDGEASILLIQYHLSKIPDAVKIAEGLRGKFPEPVPPSEEIRLFMEAMLVPLKSRSNRKTFRASSRGLADALERFVSASTGRMYREQLFTIAVILWRVVRPTILPLLIGLVLAYLVDASKEALGIHALELRLWEVFAIASFFLPEKAADLIFDEWHLKRYRTICMRTALTLYASEIRARGALIGLIVLTESEPVQPSAK